MKEHTAVEITPGVLHAILAFAVPPLLAAFSTAYIVNRWKERRDVTLALVEEFHNDLFDDRHRAYRFLVRRGRRGRRSGQPVKWSTIRNANTCDSRAVARLMHHFDRTWSAYNSNILQRGLYVQLMERYVRDFSVFLGPTYLSFDTTELPSPLPGALAKLAKAVASHRKASRRDLQ